MSPGRRVEIAGGLVLSALLVLHAWGKAAAGILPEMLWACHLATALTAIGLLSGRTGLAALGGICHLVCGLPGWILEVYLNGTTWTSVGLHVLTPVLGVWAAWRHGVSRWTTAGALLLWVVSQGLGRLCDPALNVNLAWKPYQIWPDAAPAWLSPLTNLALLGTGVGVLQFAITRLRRTRDHQSLPGL